MTMNSLTKVSFCLLLNLFLLGLPYSSPLADDEKIGRPSNADSPKGDIEFNPGRWLVSFYREHISPVDGSRCPSVPSCSSYGVKAFKKHGFFIGWMMTVDRLIHEGQEETKVSPIVFSQGKWKIYDPVENNDFWWYSPTDRDDHE